MERRIRPQVPATAKMTAMIDQHEWMSQSARVEIGGSALDKPDKIFSAAPTFLAKRPVCRSQRSDAKERSRKTVVTQQPAIKRGFKPWAPMSEMYAMCWLALIDV